MIRAKMMCLSAILFTFFGTNASATEKTHAVAALFKSSETIFQTKSSLLSEASADKGNSFVWQPFGYLSKSLEALGSQLSVTILSESENIMVGLNDFSPPNGLGSIRAKRCYIIVLRKGSTFEFSEYVKKKQAVLVADSVWNWSANLEEFGDADPRPSTIYAESIAHSYVLISNDRGELAKVSADLTSRGDDMEDVAGIPEWENIKRLDFWGYRKYRHERPPNPGVARLIGLDKVTPRAESLLLHVDLEKQLGYLRLHCSNSSDDTVSKVNATGRMPPLKPAGEDSWETDFPLGETGMFPESAIWVWWLFGMGVVA